METTTKTPLLPFAVFFETAVLATYATEREAWIAHDTAVCRGLNPDSLAVGPVTPRGWDRV